MDASNATKIELDKVRSVLERLSKYSEKIVMETSVVEDAMDEVDGEKLAELERQCDEAALWLDDEKRHIDVSITLFNICRDLTFSWRSFE